MVKTRNKSETDNASRMKEYHAKRKVKQIKIVKTSEALQLYDSLVQGTKSGNRMGSTLVMATIGTFNKFGLALLKIMQEGDTKQKILIK